MAGCNANSMPVAVAVSAPRGPGPMGKSLYSREDKALSMPDCGGGEISVVNQRRFGVDC